MNEEKPLTARELRKFGLATGVLVVLFFYVILPWWMNLSPSRWIFGIAALLWIMAWLRPTALRGVHCYWMRLAHVLGWINTRLILGIAFWLVFFPMGVAMRAFGHDPLAKKWNPSAQTYRRSRVPRDAKHMERQF